VRRLHSLDYIRINAPFMNRQTWTAEVNKVINAFAAQSRRTMPPPSSII